MKYEFICISGKVKNSEIYYYNYNDRYTVTSYTVKCISSHSKSIYSKYVV